MGGITDDKGFKVALAGMDVAKQRALAAAFVEHVADLASNERLKRLQALAASSEISDEELQGGYKTAKSITIESYTQCGKEADWLQQAGHFVAKACAAALAPAGEGDTLGPAWNAAMYARMARTSACIGGDDPGGEDEAASQYEIAERFLS